MGDRSEERRAPGGTLGRDRGGGRRGGFGTGRLRRKRRRRAARRGSGRGPAPRGQPAGALGLAEAHGQAGLTEPAVGQDGAGAGCVGQLLGGRERRIGPRQVTPLQGDLAQVLAHVGFGGRVRQAHGQHFEVQGRGVLEPARQA